MAQEQIKSERDKYERMLNNQARDFAQANADKEKVFKNYKIYTTFEHDVLSQV